MSSSKCFFRVGWILALNLSAASALRAQMPVAITAKDMFNQVGQYYKVHANKGNVSVSGLPGKAGGGNFWNFTKGPTDDVYRFDYVSIDRGGVGKDFPQAKFAERKTEQGDGSQAYQFLEQVPGVGRINYGFYDPNFLSIFGASRPSHPFSKSIVDFPDTIRFGDSWSTVTSFDADIALSGGEPDPTDPEVISGDLFGLDLRFEHTSSMKVDAYGIINLPGIGFGDALRLNELVQLDVKADISGAGEYENVETDFYRTYYWLMPGRGIVAQITSTQQGSPPPDEFSVATAFVRMFETNHGDTTSEPPPPAAIKGFMLTKRPGVVLLNWDAYPTASAYKVEATSDLGDPKSWSFLQTTTNIFVIDNLASGTTTRFYRVTTVP
ncbi:MAG: hypothetical protein HY735_21735 [Verrucomicrobia bacterium]|nr:hypothetical protein [Verrucomicrobiota bacterium]